MAASCWGDGRRRRQRPPLDASDVKRVVVVGNGVAGTLAAETVVRQAGPSVSVTVVAEEPYPLYNRVALPRLLRGDVPESKVFMRDPQHHVKAGYELLLSTRVVRVDPRERVVYTSDDRALVYDRLLIATGGRPNALQASGAETRPRGLVYFQTLDDTRAILDLVRGARRAVTVGGSYIAYELTEGLRRQGLEVVWLMRGPYFLRRVLDEDGGRLVDAIAHAHGVEVIHGEEVAQLLVRAGAVSGVVTTAGRTIEADIVACGLGLTLNTEWLEGSGVEVRKGVVTDAYLQTNVPGIFAAGDVAEFYDGFIDRHHTMGTWDNASTHGRVAAANMLGARQPYLEVPSYTSTLFDSTLYVLGMTTEVDPHLATVSSLDMESGNYRRLFFQGDRLVGAVMIGERAGRRTLKQMIREKTPVPAGERAALLHVQ
ncbi:MAG: NAD(P)/FAD-dependent oxidoreductase [Firmicutes bacterium]|nr:NAD(P)/FAD-dependent oxidoreductase [Bacillota bacterium]